MNIFDPEFYPTPEKVIATMVAPYADRIHKATILEPSAGNGAILDYLNKGVNVTYTDKRGNVRHITVNPKPNNVYAVEHNPELQMILTQKGHRLAAEDFLTFHPDIRFDLILMNPPFSSGDKHLIHAWDILEGGDIACLLNAETIRNPYTATRQQLAAIIESNGTVEELGRCFSSADNPTDVEVVLVRLHKEPARNPFKLDLDGFAKEVMPDFGELAASGDTLMQSSRLDAFLRAWAMAKASAVNYLKAREMFQLYMGAFINNQIEAPEHASVLVRLDKHLNETKDQYKNDLEGHMTDGYNFFIESAKETAWATIFRQIGLGKYMTSGLRKELARFEKEQASFTLAKENIMKLFAYIMSNIGNIMDNALVEVYDKFTRYYSGNTACAEGWKTNKQYKCNRKVILPYAVECGYMPQRYGYSKNYSPSFSSATDLDDIDKAMCWLSGRNYDSLTGEIDLPGKGKIHSPKDSTIRDVIYTITVGDQGWHESAFFRIKAFKKGTIHLEFKDEALWAKFNQAVNKGKNILRDTEPK